jgi:hypothetical protein
MSTHSNASWGPNDTQLDDKIVLLVGRSEETVTFKRSFH